MDVDDLIIGLLRRATCSPYAFVKKLKNDGHLRESFHIPPFENGENILVRYLWVRVSDDKYEICYLSEKKEEKTLLSSWSNVKGHILMYNYNCKYRF